MSLPAMPRPAYISDGHLSERIWDGVITVLAWLWRPLRWLATMAVFFALLGVFLVWLARALDVPLPDPHTLPVLRDLLRHTAQIWLAVVAVVVLLPIAWWSHGARAQTRAADDPRPQYDLQRARWLDPEEYLPRYLPRVYHWRRATHGQQPDLLARQALREAARGRRKSLQGFWVVGGPLQGKSRLAWEAVQSVVPGWTLVRWAHSASRPFDLDAVRGQRVILWLDDLASYANLAEAPTLLDLPRLFKQAHVRLVVVATCADGPAEAQARAQLGPLLNRLREVRLEDISATEAGELAGALERAHVRVRPAAFDGTPGSLVLDIPHLRNDVYPTLPEGARRALFALKLLRSAGIGICSERRVRAVAETGFGLPLDPRAWPSARDALVAAGFVRLSHARVARARAVEPVAAAYLEQAVPDYPPPGRTLADDWPRLRVGLTSRHDAAGVFNLGNQYRERTVGNRMEHLQRAEVCYWEALRICSPRAAPLTWAGAQSNLGITLAAEAQMAIGPERIQMLAVAARAYRAALPVYRRLRIWENWSRTQTNLGLALREQAELVAEPQRSALLREAVASFRTVTRRHRREVAPTTPLRAQFGLNLIEREYTEVVAAAEGGRLRQLQATFARMPALLPRGALEDTLPEHAAVQVPSPAMSHPRYPRSRISLAPAPHDTLPGAMPTFQIPHPWEPPTRVPEDARPAPTPPLQAAAEPVASTALDRGESPGAAPPDAPQQASSDAAAVIESGEIESGHDAQSAADDACGGGGDDLQPRRVVISEEIHTMLEEDGDAN